MSHKQKEHQLQQAGRQAGRDNVRFYRRAQHKQEFESVEAEELL
jgi:hypothetical protein